MVGTRRLALVDSHTDHGPLNRSTLLIDLSHRARILPPHNIQYIHDHIHIHNDGS
jgi:hypothetical protein